jgi:hypothetical protein
MWQQVAFPEAGKVHFIPTQSFRSETFTALAFQRKTEAVSRVFGGKTDTERAVLLQQMWCWSVHSELLWEVAHMCERVSR